MPAPSPSSFVARNIFTAHPDPYVWLFEITTPDGGPIVDPYTGSLRVLRATPNRTPIQFETNALGDPKTWNPYPLDFSDLQLDSDGGSFSLSLTASMAAIAVGGTEAVNLMPLLVANDYLSEHRVRMVLAHTNTLDNPDDAAELSLRVVDASADWRAASFRLSAYDEASFEVPQTIMTRDSCRWSYRRKGCDFTGDPNGAELGSCAKSSAACILRGIWEADNGITRRHPARWGGFKGLPRGAVV